MGRTPASPTQDHDQRAPRTSPSRSGATRQSLKARILSRALLISTLPLLVIGMIALSSLVGLSQSAERDLDASRGQLARDIVGRAVRTDAQGVAREVDRVIGERIDDILVLATSPPVRTAARRAQATGDALVLRSTAELEDEYRKERRLAPGSAAERYLRAVTRRQPQFSELFFTERNGLTVAASAKTSDLVQSDETWWNAAWDDRLFLGDVGQDESSGATGLTVAARIGSQRTGPLGVIRGVIRLDALQQIASRIAGETGSDITILTSDGRVLAETSSDHDPERIANPEIEFDAERATSIDQALAADGPGYVLADTSVVGFAPLAATDGRLSALLEGFARADGQNLSWVTVVEQSNDVALAPLSGLSNVQRRLSETARRFGVVLVVVLVVSLLAAFIVSTRLAQSIVRPLRALGATARDIADDQLPMLVRHAQAPSDRDDDVPAVLPRVELRTNDEIEEVADAFNIVSGTAAELAAEQARSRRNVSRMFVSLGRRNQSLLNRQLERIDKLERETSDPDLLDDMFRLDHLATRMRRNAESLLVLAGEEAARRWSEPVSLTSVVRGAIAEIEDYRRVNLDGVDEAQLVGSAVGDVTHLVAELIENATQFSPPDTTVMVVGRRVVDGYMLAIADDGVGMSEEQLEEANRRIETSPRVDRVPSSFLGLFVVGRLASRHGIRVRLTESTTEGVAAKVLLPQALVDHAVPFPSPVELGGEQTRALPEDTGAEALRRQRADELWVDVSDASPAADREPIEVSASVGGVRTDTTPMALGGRRRREPSGRDTTVDTAPFPRIEVDAAGSEPHVVRRRGAPVDGITIDVPVDPEPDDAGRAKGASDVPDGAGGHSGDESSTPADLESGAADEVAVPPDTLDQPEAIAALDDAVDRVVVRGRGSDGDRSPDGEASSTGDGTSTGDDGDGVPLDDGSVFEVRRRTSRRDGNGRPANGRPPSGRAVLRTEGAAADRPATTSPRRRASGRPQPKATDEAGVTLTAAEREARLARSRLSRFQRAVERGREHSAEQRDAGDTDA